MRSHKYNQLLLDRLADCILFLEYKLVFVSKMLEYSAVDFSQLSGVEAINQT